MFHEKGPTFWELVRQALSSTERGYDLLAPKFEYTPFRTPDQILKTLVPATEGSAPIESALDLCCGTGAAMRLLGPLCRDRVVGIDFSQGMLSVGRESIIQASGKANLFFVRGDALQIPFVAQFDLAVCFGALGHIRRRDQPRLVEQIARALKPGGRFVTVTSNLPSVWSPGYWIAITFNGVMHLRNLVIRPPFVMYYLRFLLPDAQGLLESGGFQVEVREGVFEGRYAHLKLVIATFIGDGPYQAEPAPRLERLSQARESSDCGTSSRAAPRGDRR